MRIKINIKDETELDSLMDLLGKDRVFRWLAEDRVNNKILQKHVDDYAQFIHDNEMHKHWYIDYIRNSFNLKTEENIYKVIKASKWSNKDTKLSRIFNYATYHKIDLPQTMQHIYKCEFNSIAYDKDIKSIYDWKKNNDEYVTPYREFNTTTGKYLLNVGLLFSFYDIGLYQYIMGPVIRFLSSIATVQTASEYTYAMFESKESFELFKEKIIQIGIEARDSFFKSIEHLKEREYGFWKIDKIFSDEGMGLSVEMVNKHGDKRTLHVMERYEMFYEFDEEEFWSKLKEEF